MPKIIFTSRYIKNPASSNAGKLIKYMGTREGVEKLPNGINNSPATKTQNDLICTALKTVPEAWDYPEMKSYLENKTKSNAPEFLNEFLERNADRIGGVKKLVSYYAERPGVEKLGKHGLFSQTDDKINLDEVAEEVSNHNGIVWTHVISLKREDAERLGYNNANAWKSLIRRNALEIAKAHKIEPSDLQWYGAFHNTTHHPHIHLIVYSKSRQGYLTNKGIESMRSVFGNDIFRNEQYKLFEMQTEIRDELKNEAKNVIDDLISNIDSDVYVSDEMVELFRKLAEQLKSYNGRLMYGYLPKSIKEIVNSIVAELANDKNLAKLYSRWNEINREKLSLYYDKERPDIPLEDNVLNEYFRYLTQQKYIDRNPMISAPMIKKSNFLAAQDKENLPTSETITVFTPEEIKIFKDEAFSTFSNGKRKYQQAAAYILMLNTGLRTGEALGLLNSDIDLENRVMHLNRGVKEISKRDGVTAEKGREVKVGKLKSATSKRDVPLNDTAIEMILDLRKEFYLGDNSPLIPDENGNFTRPVNFRKRYYRILKAAGIETKGLHSLRHTFATNLVKGIKQADGSGSRLARTYNL